MLAFDGCFGGGLEDGSEASSLLLFVADLCDGLRFLPIKVCQVFFRHPGLCFFKLGLGVVGVFLEVANLFFGAYGERAEQCLTTGQFLYVGVCVDSC